MLHININNAHPRQQQAYRPFHQGCIGSPSPIELYVVAGVKSLAEFITKYCPVAVAVAAVCLTLLQLQLAAAAALTHVFQFAQTRGEVHRQATSRPAAFRIKEKASELPLPLPRTSKGARAIAG